MDRFDVAVLAGAAAGMLAAVWAARGSCLWASPRSIDNERVRQPERGDKREAWATGYPQRKPKSKSDQ